MNGLKNKVTCLAFVCLLFCSEIYSQQARETVTDQDVITVARENLQRYLNAISYKPSSYGFNSVDEFDLIEIGHPYERQFLTGYFNTDTTFISNKRYFYSSQLWYVPLYVNDTIRSFINVFYRDSELRYVGGGSKNFAQRIDQTEKFYAIPDTLKRAILYPEDHAADSNCGYITAYHSRADRYSFYPIIWEFNDWCESHYPPFQPYHSFRNYFISRKTGDYYNTEPRSQVVSNSWYFFPNPFSGELYLQIPVHRQHAETITISFYSPNGQIIFREVVPNECLYDYVVPSKKFPSQGILIYKINDRDSLFTGRVVRSN